MRAHRHLVVLIVLPLCLAPCLHGQEPPNYGQTAQQLASAANDDAVSLEDRQESLRKLEEASGLFLHAGEMIEAARVLNRAGRLQLILHQPQAAVASHSKALDLVKQLSNAEVEEVDGLNGLGAAYLSLEKKKEEAEKELRQAISLSEQSGYIAGQAQALLTLSEAQNTYNHAVALETAQEALALWQTLNDKRGLAHAYAQIGQYYMAQNALPESTQNYELALNLWRDLKSPPEQAEALISLGYIEHRKGEWSSAISFYTEAQKLVDENAEPQRMGEISAGLAAAFNENGLPEIGLTHYQRALAYYQQAQNTGYVADAYFRLGVTYYLLKNYSEAITHFQQALSLVDDDTLQAECDESLGGVYLSTGESKLALEHLQSALAIYQQAFNPREVARVQALLGRVAERQQHPERARRFYQSALKTFIQLSDRVNQAAVCYALGELELKSRNYDAAENYLRQSVEVTENIRRASRSSDLTVAFSAAIYDRYEKYIECLMRQHEEHPSAGFALRAFETSEKGRASSLSELLRMNGTNLVPDIDPQLAAQEKSLRQALRVDEDYKVALLSKAYRKEELEAFETKMSQLEAEYAQVNETIRARYPAYEQITRPSVLDLEHIQERVIADDQTVLLEYSLGADKSYLWAVTRNSVTSYELPRRALIEEAAQKVYKLLSTQPGASGGEELTAAIEELGRMVLSPAATQLNRRRFIIVADGILNYIPFQVLPAPASNNEPLISSHEVVNAPSASVLEELRQEAARRQPKTKLLAAFGDPVFSSNFAQRTEDEKSVQVVSAQMPDNERLRPALRDLELTEDTLDPATIEPLFYSKRELTNLGDVAGAETLIATGFDATKEKLQSTDLSKFAILHFATHALLDAKRPENSGLLLSMVDIHGRAQNGFVGLQDIYSLRAPVELVVLSACRTGLGKEVRGEGLIGLTRGFMYAGASTVVATLWKVDDEATAELMKRFYANLLQRGMTPAEALGAAQNSLRQEGRSPYYWAAFTLQGEYRQVIRAAPAGSAGTSSLKIATGGLLLVLLAGAAWRYRRYYVKRTARGERATIQR